MPEPSLPADLLRPPEPPPQADLPRPPDKPPRLADLPRPPDELPWPANLPRPADELPRPADLPRPPEPPPPADLPPVEAQLLSGRARQAAEKAAEWERRADTMRTTRARLAAAPSPAEPSPPATGAVFTRGQATSATLLAESQSRELALQATVDAEAPSYVSSVAGCFASHGQQRSWICAVLRNASRRDGNCSVDAAIPLDVGAINDKADGLGVLFEPHKEAFNFISRHKQLSCCADRLALALRTCVCKEVLSDGTRAGPCHAVTEAREATLPLCCRLISGDENSPPRAAWTPCCFVYTGDLVNLHAVLGLGSHRADPTRFSTHVIKDETRTWVLRKVLDARRLAHSIVGVACPSCNYKPLSNNDVASEHARREAMGQAERQTHLKAHFNQWIPPVFEDLEHDHALLGVMHLGHNLFDQSFHSVWAGIETLHTDTHNLIKHDLVSALRAMGSGLLDPGRKLQAHEITLPSFKGADLSIICTDAGIMQILITVYGLDEMPPPDEDTENLSSSANVSGVARAEAAARLRAAARAAANGGVRPERLSQCVNACKALDALWKVLRRYKNIGYDASTEENHRRHAADFRADFAELEFALRAFRTGEVASQYITEARKLAPLMIIKWGRLVAYVNEQVQEHMVLLCKQLYHKSSDHSTILRNYVRTTAAGVTYTIDYLRNLAAAATENRTAWNKQAHHGSKAWEVLELAEANSMQDELADAQELAR
ncbi:hypothetical protein T492DRAFT_917551 [Pavlovales sp. CCMP2436]|nr:hypothetical protein T492DRAFT_917551 [Pavlovales sp. CCMP2436]